LTSKYPHFAAWGRSAIRECGKKLPLRAEKPANPYLLHIVVVETLLIISCGFSLFCRSHRRKTSGKSGVLKDLPVSVSAFEDGMHRVEKMVACNSNPGGTMLSADNVTFCANDSFASHHKTALGSHRPRMELEGGSLPESQRLRVGVLTFVGSLTSSADALGHDLRCEAKKPRRIFTSLSISAEGLHSTFSCITRVYRKQPLLLMLATRSLRYSLSLCS